MLYPVLILLLVLLKPGPTSSESPSVCPAAASSSSPGTSGARGSPASPPRSPRRRRSKWRPVASSQRYQPCSHTLTLSSRTSEPARECLLQLYRFTSHSPSAEFTPALSQTQPHSLHSAHYTVRTTQEINVIYTKASPV